MSFTISPVLRKPNKLGKYPIYIRLTISGCTAVYKKLSIPPIKKEEWDRKRQTIKMTVDGATANNHIINSLIQQATEYILKEGHYSQNPALLLNFGLEGKSRQTTDRNPYSISFYEFADTYIRLREEKEQFRTVQNIKVRLNNLKAFKKEIYLSEIDKAFIDKLVKHQKNTLGQSTVHRNIKEYGSIYDLAAEEHRLPINPFKKYKISPGRPKIKTIPTIAEINQLIATRPKLTEQQRAGLDIYLCQFLLRGTRVVDILTLRNDQIKKDTILIQEAKTGVWKQCGIHPLLQEIINDYHCPVYVFPVYNHIDSPHKTPKENYLGHRKQVSSGTTWVNKCIKRACNMAGIEKHLTSHTSRHAFATLAMVELGNMRLIQELLGHSQINTTEGYTKNLRRSDYSVEEEKIYKGIRLKA